MAPFVDDLPGYRAERDPYAWARTAPLWALLTAFFVQAVALGAVVWAFVYVAF